ncbi:pro-melanin-concentrating hormone, like [Limanda limanda]|uniref:pro-melanin-concentrating hormone, like n=1 Tax=Limanda limanda TaxID=27771 RepID=UPI0029C650EA|nr:pro-melanin-concentrating hormone, like [Limanda limanda]
MRQSCISIVFAAALILKGYVLSGALPMGKTEDGSMEQETFASLLSDKATENGFGDADLATEEKLSGPRVIVVADPSVWRDLRVLHNGLSLYKRRADHSDQVATQHKDAGQGVNIPILRRDNMRCMVGRVYRPCWEV